MKTNFVKYLLVFTLAIALFGCEGLDVKNLNAPDTDRVLATPGDLVGLAGGAMRTWSNAIQEYSGPALAMCTMADENTCSWGNVAMRDLSSEPRAGWNNNITYSNAQANREFWNSSYGSNSSVNDVLGKIADGTIINTQAETDMIAAKTGETVTVVSKKLPFFKCGMELRNRVDKV